MLDEINRANVGPMSNVDPMSDDPSQIVALIKELKDVKVTEAMDSVSIMIHLVNTLGTTRKNVLIRDLNTAVNKLLYELRMELRDRLNELLD